MDGPLTTVFISLRWALCQRSGLCYRCSSPELVCHPAVGADCGSDRHSAGTLHVLVHSLLRLHLPVRDCFHGQDDPYSHASQKPVLWSKLGVLLCFFLKMYIDIWWKRVSLLLVTSPFHCLWRYWSFQSVCKAKLSMFLLHLHPQQILFPQMLSYSLNTIFKGKQCV